MESQAQKKQSRQLTGSILGCPAKPGDRQAETHANTGKNEALKGIVLENISDQGLILIENGLHPLATEGEWILAAAGLEGRSDQIPKRVAEDAGKF